MCGVQEDRMDDKKRGFGSTKLMYKLIHHVTGVGRPELVPVD